MAALSKVEQTLVRRMGTAVHRYRLLEAGDRVLVALSGGKDSHSLVYLLDRLRKRVPFSFEYLVVHLDQGQPGYDGGPLETYLEEKGFPHRILHEATYGIVKEKTPEGQSYCVMCSRLRRGILYTTAAELGCNKIALGHHLEDCLETLLLNLLFNSQLKAMPPRLVSDDGRNVVIRPLILCRETDLAALAEEKGFPILPCGLCGSQENQQRQAMKSVLHQLEANYPGSLYRMIAALADVRPSHLLDRRLWNTLKLRGLTGLEPPATTEEERVEAMSETEESPFDV